MNGWLRRRSRQPPAGRSKSVNCRSYLVKRPHPSLEGMTLLSHVVAHLAGFPTRYETRFTSDDG